ncbi:hypothetical protein DPMN_105012 [Dreissena polymorpha]|uniref:Transmembrane protein n=1 Tax=Dreissena polymorpha TaxID=45954 RepID=A0A9D4HAT5_DREPO|nr:hypothetical protein DPMN_105012 [Dreissena polymorpha]
MSVCSAAVAASSRPGARKESRASNTRTSVPDVHFYNDKGMRQVDRKCSSVSSTKGSSTALCCVISVVMLVVVQGWFGHRSDFIG